MNDVSPTSSQFNLSQTTTKRLICASIVLTVAFSIIGVVATQGVLGGVATGGVALGGLSALAPAGVLAIVSDTNDKKEVIAGLVLLALAVSLVVMGSLTLGGSLPPKVMGWYLALPLIPLGGLALYIGCKQCCKKGSS